VEKMKAMTPDEVVEVKHLDFAVVVVLVSLLD
jgi:hypothetical protein